MSTIGRQSTYPSHFLAIHLYNYTTAEQQKGRLCFQGGLLGFIESKLLNLGNPVWYIQYNVGVGDQFGMGY